MPARGRPEERLPLLNDSERQYSTEPQSMATHAGGDANDAVSRRAAAKAKELAYNPPEFFGEKRPHQPTREEQCNPLSRITYQWIQPMIKTSAAGDLPTGVVSPLDFDDTAHELSRGFFSYFQGERANQHTWDAFVDSSADLMRRKDDPDSRGALVWVGFLQQSESPTDVKVAIEWKKPPKSYAKGVKFTDGMVDGERLFTCKSGKATLELPESVEFVDPKRRAANKPPQAPSVTKTLVYTCSSLFFWAVLPRLVYEACYLAQPQILEQFVLFVAGRGVSADWSTRDRWGWGIGVASMFLVTSILSTLAFQKFFHMCMRSGLRSRSTLMGMLFHKALTIAPMAASHPELSVGRVVNMMSSDVERINEAYGFLHYAWSAPLQLVIAVILLYRQIGWIVFASIALTLFSVPLQGTIMKMQMTARKNLSAATDKRLKATNELFGAVRVIKYMGWEQSFVEAVLKYRDIELGFLKKIQYYRVASSLIINAVPMLINACVFILYHVTGHTLTPEVVFPTLALLNILRLPFMVVPWMFNLIITSLVAVNRLNRFLNADDTVSAVRNLDEEIRRGDGAAGNGTGEDDAAQQQDGSDLGARLNNATMLAYQPREISERRNKFPGLFNRITRAICCCRKSKKKDEPEADERQPLNEDDEEAKKKKADEEEKKKDEDNQYHAVEEKKLLHDINLDIPRGKLTVVVGATGSGKTLLLESLLGQLSVKHGTVAALKSIAYSPQQSWIMNGTVEDNVIFFAKKDQAKFDAAARACCLDVDLEQLADGAQTEIGERGVNLSGGQRARIALARAVYADRDMYLLDDPLSAVDAHVSKALLERCFLGDLDGRTRVLVTHQHYVLPKADLIVAMEGGRIAFQGDYREYRTWAMERRLMTPATTTTAQGNESMTVQNSSLEQAGTTTENSPQTVTREASAAFPLLEDEAAEQGKEGDEKKDEDGAEKKKDGEEDDNKKGALMSTEERAQGKVPMSMYQRYLRSCGGYFRVALIILLYTVTECINAAVQVWLAIWASQSFDLERDTYLYVYIGIVAASALSGGARAFVIYSTGRLASRGLHFDLLKNLAAARSAFFDTTPLGRILNRFSKDIDTADNDLPMNFSGFLTTLFSIISSMTVMVISQPFALVAILPASYVYSKILVFYNAANREIKRVDSINKSPVFALLSETMEGAKTIAAYGQWQHVIVEAVRRVDAVFSTSYLQQVVNRWLGLRLDALGGAIVTVIAYAGVICTMENFGHMHVGMLSLGMTLAMSVTGTLNWFVRQSAAVEAGMNCVERIVFYTDDVDTEDFGWYGGQKGKKNPLPSVPIPAHLEHRRGDPSKKRDQPPAPGTSAATQAAGLAIEFKEVDLRYRPELPLVLKNLSFRIEPREKVGIVGRTGSGKSTTLQAFLRIVEIAGGRLEIGGQPHDSFALDHLRSLFAMIPQEPILFTGTVRSNLDPFDECTTPELQRALEQTNMWDRVKDDGGADCEVTEGGKNFSVGQRQLLCLARALLKPSTAFILMDEATANIDPENDRVIQRTIRTAFADRTVITIAHRLQTVIDCDKIVVMDAGEAKEVGRPAHLIDIDQGIFRSMVDALGDKERGKLVKSAQAGRLVEEDEKDTRGFDEREPDEE